MKFSDFIDRFFIFQEPDEKISEEELKKVREILKKISEENQ